MIDRKRIKKLINTETFSKRKIYEAWEIGDSYKENWITKSDLKELLKNIKNKDVVISFSHDNPFENAGGIQKIIRFESDKITAKHNEKTIYINLFPFQSYPFTMDKATMTPGKNITRRINILGEY